LTNRMQIPAEMIRTNSLIRTNILGREQQI
jgi:hypothetical protein